MRPSLKQAVPSAAWQAALVFAFASSALSCLPVGVGVTVPIAPAPAPVVLGPGFEVNVNRMGSDYRSFDIGAPQPEICQNACMNEPQCVAFTYVNPGVQGPNARCWLKNSVPPPNPDGCCISGVKYAGGPPPPPPPPPPSVPRGVFEHGIDRAGADYRSFDLPAPNPEMCREACFNEPQCRAFTYVHPRIQGPNARCWLKGSVPPPNPNGCCISGVK
jgi:1-phosphatidylinositol phosphodiesterase